MKQRREIRDRSITWHDQPPVSAAVEGRVLILDGIEKAERNVLPTLNNLLENREMALSDGRFLTDPERFDLMEPAVAERSGLVRVHPDFRVIALGLPVPRFQGFPLDPPLRSRFQGRWVDSDTATHRTAALRAAHPEAAPSAAADVISLDATLRSLGCGGAQATSVQMAGSDGGSSSGRGAASLPLAGHKVLHFPETAAEDFVCMAAALPGEIPGRLLASAYPSALFDLEEPAVSASNQGFSLAQKAVLNAALERFGFSPDEPLNAPYRLDCIQTYSTTETHETPSPQVAVRFQETTTGDAEGVSPGTRTLVAHAGPAARGTSDPFSSAPGSSNELLPGPGNIYSDILMSMVRAHCVNRDICLVGGKGSGKSALANEFSRALGYTGAVELICAYRDMSPRDLLEPIDKQAGDTVWRPSARERKNGHLAVLDGAHRLTEDTRRARKLVHRS